MTYESWGRYPHARQIGRVVGWRAEPLSLLDADPPALPFGRGRSYGDCCLNDGGLLLDTSRLDHLIDFDRQRGLLRCEAGVTLEEILRVIVPEGFFIPVSPGTQFVTVGGAIANDVHGKNHHRAGTFGRHVTRFELLRSDGTRRVCSKAEHADWFRATIGGLGLTGLVTWAEFQLKPIESPWIDVEAVPFAGVDEFLRLCDESDAAFEYTVAWVDALRAGRRQAHGIFLRGNHAPASGGPQLPRQHNGPSLTVPCEMPGWVLNRPSLAVFNRLYYTRQCLAPRRRRVGFGEFFYPLDAIAHWNRLYGRRGLLQFQCVVDPARDAGILERLLAAIEHAGSGSFLTVMKRFGAMPSPGLLSFPRPGVTLSVDMLHRGPSTLACLSKLDVRVRNHGGAIYPAKDACMAPETFRGSFPAWRRFQAYVDPKFSSSFWRRVMGQRPDSAGPAGSRPCATS